MVTDTPFDVVTRLNKGRNGRARSYSTFFEKRDAMIKDWIDSLSPEENKALETMAARFLEGLREKQEIRHAKNNPDSVNSRKVTLIGVETAMELLVLLALREDIIF